MIVIRATVEGEPDAPPFTRIFQFDSPGGEAIFANCVQAVREKLSKNLKINVNESLMVYCYYVTSELRAGRAVEEIMTNASTLILPDKVMVGVAETLRRIVFDVSLDGPVRHYVILDQPIPLAQLGNGIQGDEGRRKNQKRESGSSTCNLELKYLVAPSQPLMLFARNYHYPFSKRGQVTTAVHETPQSNKRRGAKKGEGGEEYGSKRLVVRCISCFVFRSRN